MRTPPAVAPLMKAASCGPGPTSRSGRRRRGGGLLVRGDDPACVLVPLPSPLSPDADRVVYFQIEPTGLNPTQRFDNAPPGCRDGKAAWGGHRAHSADRSSFSPRRSEGICLQPRAGGCASLGADPHPHKAPSTHRRVGGSVAPGIVPLLAEGLQRPMQGWWAPLSGSPALGPRSPPVRSGRHRAGTIQKGTCDSLRSRTFDR